LTNKENKSNQRTENSSDDEIEEEQMDINEIVSKTNTQTIEKKEEGKYSQNDFSSIFKVFCFSR
jgi:hypothetical protein